MTVSSRLLFTVFPRGDDSAASGSRADGLNIAFTLKTPQRAISPACDSYPSTMRKLPLLVLLFSSVVVAAQQMSASAPDIVATYPATLHEKLSSSCELIQPVVLMQHKQYDALALGGATDEPYSPELRKSDYVALSNAVPKEVAKSAKKSGFEVQGESTEVSALYAKPTTNGSSCPDLQQTTAEATNRRYERRVELQKHFHDVGFEVLPPMIIQQVQPESVANQKAPQSSGQTNVKFEGTVILRTAIGIDGKVHNVSVLQSLDVVLDKKAVEAVQQRKFSPARMKACPFLFRLLSRLLFTCTKIKHTNAAMTTGDKSPFHSSG